MSMSEISLEIEFENGLVLKGCIDRIRGPAIVEDIKYKLPLEGRAALLRGEMKITLDIGKGNLKPTKDVKRAEIAYMPLGDSLCIYLKDMKTYNPVNVLGFIKNIDALDKLNDVRRGSLASIRLSE